MQRGENVKKRMVSVEIQAGITGILIFILLYGVRILNPLYDAWTLQGLDLTQHYLGALFFRVSAWQFPIGNMDRICYPNSVSVVFTDSIPLMALISKLLRGILPLHFQYFGFWGLLCFALQGFFSAKLLSRFIDHRGYVWICSIFFILSPVFLYRVFYHTALASEWLILWAYDIAFDQMEGCDSGRRRISSLAELLVIAMSAAMIHIYLLVMCTIAIMFGMLIRLIRDKDFYHRIWVIVKGILYLAAALGTLVCLGVARSDQQLDAGGLTQFSFNLNGLLNPMDGWSVVLPALSAYGEGYGEGLAYLGLGMMIMTVMGVLCWLIGRIRKENCRIYNRSECIFLWITAVTALLIAVSPLVAVNGHMQFRIPYPEKIVSLWGIVRASGRFIWMVVYTIMLTSMIMLYRRFKGKKILIPLLLVLLAVQLTDLSGKLTEIHQKYTSEMTYSNLDETQVWQKVAADPKIRHIIFATDVTEDQGLMYPVAEFALDHDLTINMFYIAHNASMGAITESLNSSMQNLQDDTVYVFKDSAADEMKKYSQLFYYQIDGGYIGLLHQL